jgi:DNA topoisomerase-1
MEEPPASPTAAKRVTARCLKAVAGVLGNTPAVCRSSYVHPGVLDAYAEGRLAELFPEPDDAKFEDALIAFLEAGAPQAKAA